jgi:hypothetical protein
VSLALGPVVAFDQVFQGGAAGVVANLRFGLGFGLVAAVDEMSGISPSMEANNNLLSAIFWACLAI